MGEEKLQLIPEMQIIIILWEKKECYEVTCQQIAQSRRNKFPLSHNLPKLTQE